MVVQITFETVQKIYAEQSAQAKDVMADASSFLEELTQRIGTLKKQTLFNPYDKEIPRHLSKLHQVHLEMSTIDRHLQGIQPQDDLWQHYRDHVKQFTTRSILMQEKIEEFSTIFSTHTVTPLPIQQSIFDTFSPSASPTSSLTLKDLMAFEVFAPKKHPLTTSRSNPQIHFSETPPEYPHTAEDSDDDGYPDEIPARRQSLSVVNLAKKSRSIESGIKTLLAESENRDFEEDSTFGFDDVDAGQSIGIHIDYIQARAALFSEKSPRDLDYALLDNHLSATYRHAGKFLYTLKQMSPIQLREQGLDRIALSEVLQTLIRSLRIMHAGGKRAVNNPKDTTQVTLYGCFIERACVRIECVTKRMLEKVKEVELSLTPLIAVIDSGTHWSLPAVLTRLVIQYLIDNE